MTIPAGSTRGPFWLGKDHGCPRAEQIRQPASGPSCGRHRFARRQALLRQRLSVVTKTFSTGPSPTTLCSEMLIRTRREWLPPPRRTSRPDSPRRSDLGARCEFRIHRSYPERSVTDGVGHCPPHVHHSRRRLDCRDGRGARGEEGDHETDGLEDGMRNCTVFSTDKRLGHLGCAV